MVADGDWGGPTNSAKNRRPEPTPRTGQLVRGKSLVSCEPAHGLGTRGLGASGAVSASEQRAAPIEPCQEADRFMEIPADFPLSAKQQIQRGDGHLRQNTRQPEGNTTVPDKFGIPTAFSGF